MWSMGWKRSDLVSVRKFLTNTATVSHVSAFVLSRIDNCSSLLFGSTHAVASHLRRREKYTAQIILRIPKSGNIATQ